MEIVINYEGVYWLQNNDCVKYVLLIGNIPCEVMNILERRYSLLHPLYLSGYSEV